MLHNIITFYELARHAVEATGAGERRVTWAAIRENLGDILYRLSAMKFMVGIRRGRGRVTYRVSGGIYRRLGDTCRMSLIEVWWDTFRGSEVSLVEGWGTLIEGHLQGGGGGVLIVVTYRELGVHLQRVRGHL